ncbi:hypothetical protein CBOM_07023 [Ceraceosorus bombacis]|uniref:Uncharacterized protein n=1 Tax=Ceraceosorus bombacis TaxID=401625 RepID=A0A0P1BKR2_9BASI|nr:hypothetical protein CBOM_07023 [Ceraceosorus bombacis]
MTSQRGSLSPTLAAFRSEHAHSSDSSTATHHLDTDAKSRAAEDASPIDAALLLASLAAQRASRGSNPYRSIPRRFAPASVSRSRSRSSSRKATRQNLEHERSTLSSATRREQGPPHAESSRDGARRWGLSDSADESDASDDSSRTAAAAAVRYAMGGGSVDLSREEAQNRPRANTLRPPSPASKGKGRAEPVPITPTLLRSARSTAHLARTASSTQLCMLNAEATSLRASRDASPIGERERSRDALSVSPPWIRPNSPQTASGDAISGRGRPSASAPGVQTARLPPSLAAISRGRSDHVSPSRLGRRGTSASVLSTTGPQDDSTAAGSGSKLVRKHSLLNRPTSRTSIDLEGALFGDEEDVHLTFSSCESGESDVEDATASSPPNSRFNSRGRSSRRSSGASRDRKRGLRVLLQPITDIDRTPEDASTEQQPSSSCATSLGTSGSAGSEHDRRSSHSVASSRSSSCDHLLEFRAQRAATPRKDAVLAGDVMPCDATGLSTAPPASRPIATLTRQRSSRRAATLSRASSLARSNSGRSRATQSLARIVLDDQRNSSSRRGRSSSRARHGERAIEEMMRDASSIEGGLGALTQPAVRVEAEDGDPLLCPSTVSIADLVSVPAVEWDSDSDRRQSISSVRSEGASGEQEAARRSGFAAAYSERIASIGSHFKLWSRHGQQDEQSGTIPQQQQNVVARTTDSMPVAAPQRLRTTSGRPQVGVAHENASASASASTDSSLFSASWRTLSRLPNLLLLPTLATRSASPPSAVVGASQPTSAATSLSPHDAAAQLAIAPCPLAPKAELPPSPDAASSESLGEARDGAQQASPKMGRGVVSPLEGDRDAGAYVSGLGAPIDPDIELSSVVQLQTFRSRSRSASRSRGYAAHRMPHLSRPPSSPDQSSASRRTSASRARTRVSISESASSPDLSPAASPSLHKRESEAGIAPLTLPEPTLALRNADAMRAVSAPTSPRGRRARHESRGRLETQQRDDDEDEDGDGFRLVHRRGRRARRRASVGRSEVEAEEAKASPKCSRPAVQAPVPETFSAYASSASHSASEDERSSASETERHGCKDVARSTRDEEVEERGRRSRSGRGRRRSTSPSGARQNAAAQAATSASPPVTLPGAPIVAPALAPFDDRGRTGSVKVVSVSAETSTIDALATDEPSITTAPRDLSDEIGMASEDAMQPDAILCASETSEAASNSTIPVPTTIALRPCMVSNGAHLLMLSLELEMMRARKISASLKPRWLKARMREVRIWDASVAGSLGAEEGRTSGSPAMPLEQDQASGAGVSNASNASSRGTQMPAPPLASFRSVDRPQSPLRHEVT